MPDAGKALEVWDAKHCEQSRTVADTIARIDRVAPYTQTPIPNYPSKVEKMAIRKVKRRDPQAAREAIASRVTERQQQARAFAEARTQQQSAGQKLSRQILAAKVSQITHPPALIEVNSEPSRTDGEARHIRPARPKNTLIARSHSHDHPVWT